MKPKVIVVDRSPLAVTSSGVLLIGLNVMCDGSFELLIEKVRAMGTKVFLGAVVEGPLRRRMRKDLDDLAWDSAWRFAADLQAAKAPKRQRNGR
jgi:predicted lactoylglutathione lyase